MVNKKLKILAYMDSPSVATGFATVARNVLMGLHATGKYEIIVAGINYWGFPHPYPFPIYPVGINNNNDPYGREFVSRMMVEEQYDILFTIQDTFILEFMGQLIDQIRASKPGVKWVTYFPIDGTPKRPWLDAMRKADIAVTYTEWAKEECLRVLPTMGDLRVVPHGVNVRDFFPVPKGENVEFRNSYFTGMQGKFLVLNVNRNQQRKDIPRSMVAFKKFQEKHPDSFYYIHAAVRDHGWELDKVAAELGLELNKDVGFPINFGPNQGFPTEIVNRIYNASDVVISTTTGEGWGLAQVEAMACCKPVISPDNTACTEIVGEDRGYLVPSGAKHSPNLVTVLSHDNEVLRSLTDIDGLVDAMCQVYENPAEASKRALAAYKWVTTELRWDKHVVPKWVEIFDEVAAGPAKTGTVATLDL